MVSWGGGVSNEASSFQVSIVHNLFAESSFLLGFEITVVSCFQPWYLLDGCPC